MRFGDVFDVNGNIPFPDPNGFVVSRGDKPPVIVHKSDGIYSSQMAVIFLDNTSRSGVPTNYLFVGHSGEEEMRPLVVCIELDAICYFAIGEAFDALSGLCVPQFDESVVTARYETIA